MEEGGWGGGGENDEFFILRGGKEGSYWEREFFFFFWGGGRGIEHEGVANQREEKHNYWNYNEYRWSRCPIINCLQVNWY